jgi:hypothetical protein
MSKLFPARVPKRQKVTVLPSLPFYILPVFPHYELPNLMAVKYGNQKSKPALPCQ